MPDWFSTTVELAALPPTTMFAVPLPLVVKPAMVWLLVELLSPTCSTPLVVLLPSVRAVPVGRRLSPPERMIVPFCTAVVPP